MSDPSLHCDYVAVILAGGEARRMQGMAEKGLKTILPFRGTTLLQEQMNFLQNQIVAPQRIGLSLHTSQRQHMLSWLASRPDVASLAAALIVDESWQSTVPVLETSPQEQSEYKPRHKPRQGPMAGIVAALEWAAALPDQPQWLLTLSGDSFDLPTDLISRLLCQTKHPQNRWIVVGDDSGLHPPIALWHTDSLAMVRQSFSQGERKIDRVGQQLSHATVTWSGYKFFNINTQVQYKQSVPADED